MKIRQIDRVQIGDALEVIRKSFGTVADEFALTPENCPGHPAFLTMERLLAHMDGGLRLFGCYVDEVLAGTVGIKLVSPREFEIERLAVILEYRHRRLGSELLTFALEQIVREGGDKAHIGIIYENDVLKRWYERQGFVTTSIKQFPGLPFTVCLMEKVLTCPTRT